MKIMISCSPSFLTLSCGNFTDSPSVFQKAVPQLRLIHRPCIHGENRPLMFSWCERACAVCGWRAGMYGWNAGRELSDRFGLW